MRRRGTNSCNDVFESDLTETEAFLTNIFWLAYLLRSHVHLVFATEKKKREKKTLTDHNFALPCDGCIFAPAADERSHQDARFNSCSYTTHAVAGHGCTESVVGSISRVDQSPAIPLPTK
jgi:hypothetical protein